MNRRGTGRRRIQRVRAGGEAGVTLLEIVVAMSIMSLVMAAFTTGVVAMYRAANRTEAIATAESQITIAFERLDKEIRYASAISKPDRVGSSYVVEYLTTTGVGRCGELRLDPSGNLRLRAWDQGATPPAWTTAPVLASNLRTDKQPFQPADNANFQRLEVTLDAAGGSGAARSTAHTDVTFTALNSQPAARPEDKLVCQEGRTSP
ncbi:type II secretion system protein [Planosporangium thailandense]|uniref:Type II secretion system protein n=1 Tax=Planosporangium thailandense TaxID=765197 RepID=A0ABX0Y834_9ACTN|nr:type II secretion system protein [Planosporangium thailandense]NJC74193.1 type II secretion system protein [Planosporangium thailandense]